MLISKEALLAERRRYFVAARGGLSLPVAGAIYWAVLGLLAATDAVENWGLTAAMLSGFIFPLGLALQYPLKAKFMGVKSPVSSVAMWAIMAINFLWPVHFVVISAVPAAAPLTLAIGMTLHWPIIGWSYASRACYAHAIARIAVVTAIWYGFPEWRYTGVSFAVAGLYLMAAAGIALEVAWTRRRLHREGIIDGPDFADAVPA